MDNQRDSSNLSNSFSVSLSNEDFVTEDTREDGLNILSMPGLNHGRPSDSFGLQQFWNNDDPWSLINPTSSSQINRQNQVPAPYYQQAYSFSNYRSQHLPSDSGTLPADSGYGSHDLPFSVQSTSSVHEDDGTLDPLAERIYHLGRDNTSYAANVPGQSELRFQCQDCKSWVKTRSELNKHNQRHRKPFQCDYPNCSRREGFSTKNDLLRHKKTVHKEHNGNGPVYICRDGACAEKQKLWPRADNFRQHLARVHAKELRADDDLSSYLHQSSPLREDLKGVGSSVGHLDYSSHPQQIQEQGDLFASSNPNRAKTPLSYQVSQNEPGLLATLDWPQSSSEEDVLSQDKDQTSDPSTNVPPNRAEASILNDAERAKLLEAKKEQKSGLPPDDAPLEVIHDQMDIFQVGSSMDEDMEVCQSTNTITDDTGTYQDQQATTPSETAGRPTHTKLHQVAETRLLPPSTTSHRDEMLKYLESVPTEVLENALKGRELAENKDELVDEKQDSKPQNQCPECHKSFNRPCELKKHMKRHEKPYGCTFKNCRKEFGSKNDWKRHESSQHYLLETWNCEENGCKKICQRREGFKLHLQKDHSLENVKVLEEKLERCRMGRHCDPRFWCGFCISIIEIEGAGVNSWMKRCDHIDNHLMGKDGFEKKRSSEWKHLEDQHPKEPQRHPSRNETTPTASASASGMTKSNSRRRKAGLDKNPQPAKRSKVESTLIWTCHHCNGSSNNLKTTLTCPDCDHQWCSACDVQQILLKDDQGGQSVQASNGDDGEDDHVDYEVTANKT
ncbi:Sex-determining transformer protein 1 [Paramyrothecium foliicola]|nr:Sex-determining transformer protein 1 [Paramyrothecium foliicola]